MCNVFSAAAAATATAPAESECTEDMILNVRKIFCKYMLYGGEHLGNTCTIRSTPRQRPHTSARCDNRLNRDLYRYTRPAVYLCLQNIIYCIYDGGRRFLLFSICVRY